MLEPGSTSGRRERRTVASQADVERKLAQLQVELRAQRQLQVTVGEFLACWLVDFLPITVGSPNTLDNYKWAINTHLVPALGDTLLVDLSPADVAMLLQHKADAGMSTRSVARLRICLSAALNQAVAEGLVARTLRSSYAARGVRFATAGR